MKLFYVIPVFNDESSLLELIKKIKTLNSSYDNNFLIINDASTDNTESIVKNIIKLKC